MKKISKYILPRITWFHLYYDQWFKNPNGIKGFADQVMNWLMRETLALASNLKKQSKQLAEEIKNHLEALNKILVLPFIESDEFPGVRSKMRSYWFLIFIAVLAEFGFNFFAASILLPMKGWTAIVLQVFLSAFSTFGFVKLFELLFTQVFNEPKYKTDIKPKRHIGKMVFYIIMVIAYEYGVYYLCKVRGASLEGAHGFGDVTMVAMIFGMLAPIVAGYYGYERNRYSAAYSNTIKINGLQKMTTEKNNTIKTNQEHMEIHFKQRCQEQWAFHQEFRLYKENYNIKKKIEKEDLQRHFCENQESFIKEAMNRYNKAIIYDEHLKVTEITPAQQNGHKDLFKDLILK